MFAARPRGRLICRVYRSTCIRNVYVHRRYRSQVVRRKNTSRFRVNLAKIRTHAFPGDKPNSTRANENIEGTDSFEGVHRAFITSCLM